VSKVNKIQSRGEVRQPRNGFNCTNRRARYFQKVIPVRDYDATNLIFEII